MADVRLPTRVRAGRLPVVFRSCTDTWLDLGLDEWRDTHSKFVPGSSSTDKRRKKKILKLRWRQQAPAPLQANRAATARRTETAAHPFPRFVSYCGDFVL